MQGNDIIFLKKNLRDFEASVQKLEKMSLNHEKLNSHDTFRPYFFKHFLKIYLDSLEEDSQDYRELKGNYDRVIKNFSSIEQKFGKAFHEILFRGLEMHMNRFPIIIEHFGDPEDLDFFDETANDSGMLDAIVYIFSELSSEYDLRELKSQFAEFDAQYRKKFYNKIEKIVECCPSFERQEFPEEFWWHHPLKILEEKNAKQR